MNLRSNSLAAVPERLTELWKIQGDELLVLSDAHFNLRSYRLNGVAQRVWGLMDGQRSVRDIGKSISTEFPEQDQRTVLRDVTTFLTALEERGVVALQQRSKCEVLLLVPPLSRYYSRAAAQVAENSAPPLGLLYIAGVLRDAGIDVAVRDMAAEGMSVFDCARILHDHSPRIVGVSVLTNVIPETEEILRQVKALAPDTRTVVGGIHPTAMPAEMLENTNIDYLVRGEGEYTMLHLARAILDGDRIPDIPGLCHRREGDVVLVQETGAVTDLDSLPLPARELAPMEQYLQKGAVLSSRGCPYSCYFCSTVEMNMHRYRLRSPEMVVEEMVTLEKQFGLTEFEFQDDNFTARPSACRRLCELLLHCGYTWGCQGTLRQLADDLTLLDSMVAAGCKHIFFGLETGDDKMLQKLKGVSVAGVKKVVTHAVRLGVHVAAGFIIGHPEDTSESIARSLELALWLRARDVHTPAGVLNCFPGSPVQRSPSRYNVSVVNTCYEDFVFPRVNIETRSFDRDTLRATYVDFVSTLAGTYDQTTR